MAKAKTEETTTETKPEPVPVSLSREEWSAVLSLMEVGIKAIGATAFEQGGALMRVVAQQVKSKE